ncbi:hypothetical protein G9A89_008256 [Geosiphon pyriformis]|nr:hypothetical protein G9A89_008256 [Geosiphon pyriformis]
MKMKEIKRTTRLDAHDCNVCEICQESIKYYNDNNSCAACWFKFFEKHYKDFSSGNKVVDEIIKNPIYIPPNRSNGYEGSLNYYEWIPWERLSNINEIARGGFGRIYKATLIDGLIYKWSIKHHGSMEFERKKTFEWGLKIDKVAIKIIPKNSSEVFKEGGYLSHCISPIWGITQNPETLQYGIVMGFAEHGDMRKYLSTNFHSTSWEDKLMIAFDIAEGLDSIHSSGMVHRDLHSGNILQLNTISVNIGDLGLCQPVKNEAITTEKKKIYGVIPYIPPEVLRGEKFTTAGDIYSYGMLLWELATGKPPFHDCPHDHILINAILNGYRHKITSPFIPPSIAKIIVKCWDINPKNRPTAREVWNKYWKFSNRDSEFIESDKYVKEMLKTDSTTKPLGIFSRYIQNIKKTKQRDEIAKLRMTTTSIHPGAVYTSRLLTAQMVDFSKG